MDFNEQYFQALSVSPPVEALVVGVAQEIMGDMVSTAPEDTGAYKRGFHIEVKHQKRSVALIVNKDPKTLIIQAKTGHMVRSLQRAKKGHRG